MEAGGGLVEDESGAAGLALGKFAASLMRWASPPESVGGGLAERDVAEADSTRVASFC